MGWIGQRLISVILVSLGLLEFILQLSLAHVLLGSGHFEWLSCWTDFLGNSLTVVCLLISGKIVFEADLTNAPHNHTTF